MFFLITLLVKPVTAKSIAPFTSETSDIEKAVSLEIRHLRKINQCAVIEKLLKPKTTDIQKYLNNKLQKSAMSLSELSTHSVNLEKLISMLNLKSSQLSNRYLEHIRLNIEHLTDAEKQLSLVTEWRLLSCQRIAFHSQMKN